MGGLERCGKEKGGDTDVLRASLDPMWDRGCVQGGR